MSYTIFDFYKFFLELGMSENQSRKMIDYFYSKLENRPIGDINFFDEWLHEKYDDYEDEKSIEDICIEKFGEEKTEKIKYYLGL